MAQFEGTINPANTDGPLLASLLSNTFTAVRSLDSGATRPTYLPAGGIYMNTANSSLYRLIVFDGSHEIVFAVIDTVNDKPRLVVDSDSNTYIESGGNDKVNFVVGGNTKITLNSTGIFVGGSTGAGLTFDTSNTDAIQLPVGNTYQRPSRTTFGMVRANSETRRIEVSTDSGGTWQSLVISGQDSVDDEQIRDIIGDTLIGSGGVTVTVNDPADTITISANTGISVLTRSSATFSASHVGGFTSPNLPADIQFLKIFMIGLESSSNAPLIRLGNPLGIKTTGYSTDVRTILTAQNGGVSSYAFSNTDSDVGFRLGNSWGPYYGTITFSRYEELSWEMEAQFMTRVAGASPGMTGDSFGRLNIFTAPNGRELQNFQIIGTPTPADGYGLRGTIRWLAW